MFQLQRALPALRRRAEWDGFLTLCTDNLAKIVILLLCALYLPSWLRQLTAPRSAAPMETSFAAEIGD